MAQRSDRVEKQVPGSELVQIRATHLPSAISFAPAL
jgi:hypothetical protein